MSHHDGSPPPLDRPRFPDPAIRTGPPKIRALHAFFETEVIHRGGPWRGVEAAQLAALGRVDGLHLRRLLGSFGHVVSAELEADDHRRQEAPTRAARLVEASLR